MQAARLDQLVPSVLVKLPGAAGEKTILRALQNTARRFCQETEIWEQKLTPINADSSLRVYTLVNDWQASIRRVMKLYSRTAAEVTAGEDGTLIDLTNASFNPGSSTLTWDEIPFRTSVTNGLVPTVVLEPFFQCNEIADWLLQRWADAFIFGAASELCGYPGTNHYSPDLQDRYGVLYRQQKVDAMREHFAKYSDTTPIIEKAWSLL